MINSIIRSVIIYICVIAVVRLMGKRQIGELQPSELVITMILSEVVAKPLEDDLAPILPSVIMAFLLACFEVISSEFSVKSPRMRQLIQGNPVLVIKSGHIIEKNLKSVRFSVDDLTSALRLKDIFDIKSVDFAYIETNGAISIKLKKDYQPPTKNDENSQDGVIPYLIISDGKIIDRNFKLCNMSQEKLSKILDKKGLKAKDVLLMTADSTGEINVIRKQVKSI